MGLSPSLPASRLPQLMADGLWPPSAEHQTLPVNLVKPACSQAETPEWGAQPTALGTGHRF